MPPRTSITKAQRETAAASELIVLCQSFTEDGHLADEEISALRDWLAAHCGEDLPAVTYLTVVVEKILADGKVSPAERIVLHKAIETVLPVDIRASVRGKRVSTELIAKTEREFAKQAARNERELNYAIDTWDFIVAGIRYEGRAEVAKAHGREGDVAYLVRDRRNRHSRNAVEVRLSNGMQVGFVPEEHAVDIAPLLDAGHRHGAHIKKLWTWEGGDVPVPVIIANLFAPDATRPDALLERDVPSAQTPLIFAADARDSAKRGCLSVVVVALAAAASACALFAH